MGGLIKVCYINRFISTSITSLFTVKWKSFIISIDLCVFMFNVSPVFDMVTITRKLYERYGCRTMNIWMGMTLYSGILWMEDVERGLKRHRTHFYTIIVLCWSQYEFLCTLKRYSPKPLGWGEYWFLRSIKSRIDRYKRL